MAGFLGRLKLIGKSGEQDYSEVDLGQFEEPGGSSETVLRVAELGRIEVLPEIKQEIYAGNIVLVDIAGLKRDKQISIQAHNLPLTQVLWLIMSEAGGSDLVRVDHFELRNGLVEPLLQG